MNSCVYVERRKCFSAMNEVIAVVVVVVVVVDGEAKPVLPSQK